MSQYPNQFSLKNFNENEILVLRQLLRSKNLIQIPTSHNGTESDFQDVIPGQKATKKVKKDQKKKTLISYITMKLHKNQQQISQLQSQNPQFQSSDAQIKILKQYLSSEQNDTQKEVALTEYLASMGNKDLTQSPSHSLIMEESEETKSEQIKGSSSTFSQQNMKLVTLLIQQQKLLSMIKEGGTAAKVSNSDMTNQKSLTKSTTKTSSSKRKHVEIESEAERVSHGEIILPKKTKKSTPKSNTNANKTKNTKAAAEPEVRRSFRLKEKINHKAQLKIEAQEVEHEHEEAPASETLKSPSLIPEEGSQIKVKQESIDGKDGTATYSKKKLSTSERLKIIKKEKEKRALNKEDSQGGGGGESRRRELKLKLSQEEEDANLLKYICKEISSILEYPNVEFQKVQGLYYRCERDLTRLFMNVRKNISYFKYFFGNQQQQYDGLQ